MKHPNVRGQGGQLILESVLIIVILFAVTLTTAQFFKSQELVKKLISGPWLTLAGLIQNGTWQTVTEGAVAHPNGHGRHIVITGEPAQ